MSNIQKQHKISPAIAWLTIQKFIIFYCPLDREHTKSKLSRGGSIFHLHTMKSLTNNLACIRYQDKCCWLILLDIVTKFDCLRAVERSEDNIFFVSGKCTLSIYNSCAAVQLIYNEITDWLWIIAYNVKIFRKIKAFNKVVDHERTNGKTEEGVQSGLDVKYKASGNCDQNVGYEQCFSDIETAVFFNNHSNDIRPAT